MRSTYLFIILSFLLLSCQNNVQEKVVHRRNFSKNVFEEEFASVQIGCDTNEMTVLLPNTKWLDIDPKYRSPEDPDQHVFKLNKILELKERTFDHELVLEKIDNGAFMFRYTGIQTITDTLKAVELTELDASSKIDSTRIFSFEGTKYYKVAKELPESKEVKTIYKAMKTADKGRVVCACDYYF